MKYALITLAILAITSCNSTPSGTTIAAKDTLATSASQNITPAHEQLLTLFKEISFDTLAVTTPDTEKGDSPFMGTELDSTFIQLLPEEILRHRKSYAVARFLLDPDNTALIARVPGEREVNEIVLLIYNHIRKKISYRSRLTYDWGDGAAYETHSSWLIHTRDHTLHQLLNISKFSETDTDDPKDAVATQTNDYFLINITPYRTDTLSKDSTRLLQAYEHLLQNQDMPTEIQQ